MNEIAKAQTIEVWYDEARWAYRVNGTTDGFARYVAFDATGHFVLGPHRSFALFRDAWWTYDLATHTLTLSRSEITP